MRQTTHNDPDIRRALEILAESPGDLPLDRAANPALELEFTGTTDDTSGDIPLAPGTTTLLMLRFAKSDELNQELSFLIYRRRAVSELPDSPLRAAALAGIDSRLTTFRLRPPAW